MLRILTPLLCATYAAALRPLPYVYHYPATDGDWLGARIPDHIVAKMGHRRLATEAVSLRGDVALTTVTGTTTQGNGAAIGTCVTDQSHKCSYLVDENVYGPFEGGFTSRQDPGIKTNLGCSDTSKCYSEGGMDVATAEAVCAHECNIKLPRDEGGMHYAFLNSCGGHTKVSRGVSDRGKRVREREYV